MDKILYCSGAFSTYNARFLYTQETDAEMMQKQKDIIELSAKYDIPLHIKVHPSDEKANYAHFTYLTRNYPQVKVIGGYWKWFNNAERLIPRYQLVILDIIRTALIPVMARSTIPCIIYTKRKNLIGKWKLQGLHNIFWIVSTRAELEKKIKAFLFGELYQPENEQLIKKWFEKRETIQQWYKVGLGDMILRRKFRHEWNNSGEHHIDMQKLWKRINRITKPPKVAR